MLILASCRNVLRCCRAYSGCSYQRRVFKPRFQPVRHVRSFKLLGEGEAAHGMLFKGAVGLLVFFYIGGAIRYVLLRDKREEDEERRLDIAKEYYLVGHKRRAARQFLEFSKDLTAEVKFYATKMKRDRLEFAVHVVDMTATVLMEISSYAECEELLRELLAILYVDLKLPETDLLCVGLGVQLCELYAQTNQLELATGGFDLCVKNARTLVQKANNERSQAMLGIALEKAGRHNMSIGNYPKAKAYIQESLELAREVLGTEDENVVGLLNDYSAVCEACGQYDESVQAAREGLELARKIGSTVMEEQVALQHNLGLVMLHAGDRKGGKKEIEAALKMAESAKDIYSVQKINENLEKIRKEDEELSKDGWLTSLK